MLQVGEQVIPDTAWPRRAARELFLLLLATPRHTLPRDRVLDLLWPEADANQACNALYKAMHALRRVLEPKLARGEPSAYLQMSAGTVGIRSGIAVIVDADRFEALLAAAGALPDTSRAPLLREALALYRGDLLADETGCDWTAARREGLRRRWRRASLELAALELSSGTVVGAFAPLDALLDADASDEQALRLIMPALAQLGRRDEALRRYEEGRLALRDSLGLEPAAATREIATQIRMTPAPGVAPPPASTLPVACRRWEEIPAPATPLVGRSRELERILDLFWRPEVRLVTLTGPGGVGKTRLALEVAAVLSDDLAQGACFVDLAPVRDPALVLPAVARALGLNAEQAESPLAALREALRGAEMLLLLDNLEQVIAAAPAIADLLSACPRLHILATSREPLKLRAEHLVSVPSLNLPAARNWRYTLADLATCEAPALFLQRARAVAPGATFGDADAEAIAAICTRLDGLPLAIELAAARSNQLSPATLLDRLDPSLPLLTGGFRDLPTRQQTLRDTIAWSYDLLTPEEQHLLGHLAVFGAEFDLDAADTVTRLVRQTVAPETPNHVTAPSTADLIAALAARSLVQWEPGTGDAAPRGRMLETIREYALEQLREQGEETVAREAHLTYAIAFAREARGHRDHADQGAWLDAVAANHDTLRTALTWALTHDPGRALHLAMLLGWFWQRRARYREAASLLERVIAATDHLQTPERARVLNTAGWIAETLGQRDQAARWHEEALALARQLGHAEASWVALNNLGTIARVEGEIERAVALHEEALDIASAAGDSRAMDMCLNNLANALLARGDIEAAAERLAESVALCRELGDPLRLAETLVNVGAVDMWRGDTTSAIACFEESLAVFRAVGYLLGVAVVLSNFGEILIRLGDVERGIDALHESLHHHRELGDERGAAIVMMNLAEGAALQGSPELAFSHLSEALRLLHAAGDRAVVAEALEQVARYLVILGQAEAALSIAAAAESMRLETGAVRQEANVPLHDETLAQAHTALDAQAAQDAWAAGLAWQFDAAVAEAIAQLTLLRTTHSTPQPA